MKQPVDMTVLTTYTERHTIGKIVKGQHIGRTRYAQYIWQACEDCGHQRWVQLNHGSPAATRCPSCARKRNHKEWWV